MPTYAKNLAHVLAELMGCKVSTYLVWIHTNLLCQWQNNECKLRVPMLLETMKLSVQIHTNNALACPINMKGLNVKKQCPLTGDPVLTNSIAYELVNGYIHNQHN